jgi:hypothetical protein
METSSVVPTYQITYVDIYGIEKVHTVGSMPRSQMEGSLEQCMMLEAWYIQRVMDSLNVRYPYLFVFNAVRLFSPKHYPFDDLDGVK